MEYPPSFIQPFTEIIETNAKNGVFPASHKQCKTLFNDHMVTIEANIIIYL